jgi:hypothetical protein
MSSFSLLTHDLSLQRLYYYLTFIPSPSEIPVCEQKVIVDGIPGNGKMSVEGNFDLKS